MLPKKGPLSSLRNVDAWIKSGGRLAINLRGAERIGEVNVVLIRIIDTVLGTRFVTPLLPLVAVIS